MKQFNRIIAGIVIMWILMAAIASAALYGKLDGENSRGYKIDINRINTMLSEGTKLKDIDLKQLNYIVAIDLLTLPCSAEDINDFFEGHGIDKDYGFVLQPVFSDNGEINSGYLRFTYREGKNDNKFFILMLLNLCLFFMVITIVLIMFYIRHSILKPFNQMVQLPYEMSKGHFKTELKENKNRFFGKFIWGLNLLRESLEAHKLRELQLEKEKKTMVLSISHDIKTPLSTIKLYSKAIYDNLYNTEDKKAQAARHIEEKADQIESFVSQLITTSTQDILDIQVKPGEFYLRELLVQIKKTYEEKLKLIKTDFFIESFEDVLLKGDLERLIEVFENIIENAIKYGDGKLIKITFSDEDYCKLIAVTNSGLPMPNTDFIHMFESFWRGSNAHNKNGSGLGLYICKEIMKKMNGDIFAESTESTMSFIVVVPYS